MKCDELKPLVYSIVDLAYIDEIRVTRNFKNPHDHAVYKATEVDAAIAELKQKLHDVEMSADLAEAAETERKIDYDKLKAENERLTRELEHVKNGDCINTCDVLEKYGKELRATRRALWIARAYRAEARKNYWYARSCHEGDKRLWSIDGSPVKYIGCIKRTNFDWLKVWSEVECKCLKKAKEYK